jgi:phosphoribosylformimino-5-aminoimidazole carboxamide ribotide isomerase
LFRVYFDMRGGPGIPGMEIIPVIDIKNGHVVRARLGRRDEYRPIDTPLSATSSPVDVARGLLSLHPFKTLYVADLDAIESTGNNDDVLGRLKAGFPGLSLWVDNGVRTRDAARDWLAAEWGDLVLGSESQADLSVLRALESDPRLILSLDFRGEAFQGPQDILINRDIWPRRVIAMTLARVGSGAGPDIERLAALRLMAPDRQFYAAGGVRDMRDIKALARERLFGALVATSLHEGRLTARDIAAAAALEA